MKILYVTNMYPSKDRIYDGIFIKEQVDSYNKKYKNEFRILVINGQKSKFNYIKSILWVNWIILKEKFDLIHIHFGLSGMFLLFNPLIRIPSVVTLHGSDIQSYKREGLTQKITRLVVRRATRVIVQNDNMLDILKLYKDKLVKIPCGINTSMFNLNRNNTGDVFLIGFPSDKKRPVKNYDLFKKIIDHLINEGNKVETFEFIHLTREQVAASLSRLDCLLMTSLSEGSPQIIKEALASNVPIISTNVGDVKLLLEDVENCFVIDSFEVEPFVRRIQQLIQLKPSERRTNGSLKLKTMSFNQDPIIDKIYNLYKDIIKRKENLNK